MPELMKTRYMKPRSAPSLAATLSIAYVAFMVVAFLVFGGLLLLFYVQSHQEVISGNQRYISQDAARTVSGFIQEKTSLLAALLRMDNPMDMQPEKRKQYLAGVLGIQPSIRTVFLLNTQNRIVAQASRISMQASKQLSERLERDPIVSDTQEQNQISPVYIDPLTSEPMVILAVPVTNIFRDYQGYLACELNLKFMWELVDQLDERAKGKAYVVDRQGNLIASSDTARVLRGENVSRLKVVRNFVDSSAAPGESGVEIYKGILGEIVAGSFSALVTPDWAVVVEVALEEAYRTVIRTIFLSIIVFLVFSVLAGLLGILIARRLASPLVHLTETATLIAAGADGVQAAINGPREVASLASSFNSMTSQLLANHASLEAQLVEIEKGQQDKARLEQQLLQSQKMESIGRLAGGVAHDFNNMLNVILGFSELIRLETQNNDPLLEKINEIERAAGHARDITRQLLAFSRKQIISPVSLDINGRIKENREALARFIGEDIDFQFYPGRDIWKVVLDPSQLSQIVYNLAINARDAMPNGGKLTIETANIVLDETYCREHIGFSPGNYVLLTVSDNGIGMDRKTQSHLFEPFFTTKEVGKGTGLGLATVYGIVKQNGGFINVYSEPGQGTAFNIYFKRDTEEAPVGIKAEEKPVASAGGTIVLVEDNEMMRTLTTRELEKLGYEVLPLVTPMEALSVFEKGDTPFLLLLTDVVMPGMNGVELKRRIAALRPGIKVLFMSGYTANMIAHHGELDKDVHFLQKPFTLNELAKKIREAIEG